MRPICLTRKVHLQDEFPYSSQKVRTFSKGLAAPFLATGYLIGGGGQAAWASFKSISFENTARMSKGW